MGLPTSLCQVSRAVGGGLKGREVGQVPHFPPSYPKDSWNCKGCAEPQAEITENHLFRRDESSADDQSTHCHGTKANIKFWMKSVGCQRIMTLSAVVKEKST